MSPDSEYPHAIGAVATRELAGHGYTTYARLAEASEKELLAIHGVGAKAVRILAGELAARGLSFRRD